MAKQKKTEADMYADLASIAGAKLLGNEPPVNYYIDTGNLAVNFLMSGIFIGGGYPGGRIIELLGPSAGGKSLWGCNFARGLQVIDGVPVYLDAENALNPQFVAKASHLDPYKLVHVRPRDGIDCLERAFLKVHNIIRGFRSKNAKQPLGFVYDSISVSPSERELRETNISEDFTEAEWKRVVGAKEQPGERAKICNKEFRKLESVLEKTDTTMLVINQLRQKIGVVYGNPEVGSTASTVLEYYSCMRLRVSAHKKIENKLGRIIGINLKVKNIKNRINTPFMEAEGIQLFYEKGVNPLSGLLTLMEQAERIEATGKGTYRVKEPWAGGQNVTFRATKSANMVDAEVLYKCPALVDAKDEQQVRDYLSVFSEAINQSNSDDSVEKDITTEFFDEEENEDKAAN
jgi:recombination protein RecA